MLKKFKKIYYCNIILYLFISCWNCLPSDIQSKKKLIYFNKIFFSCLLALYFLLTHFPNYCAFVSLSTHAFMPSFSNLPTVPLSTASISTRLCWRLSPASSFIHTTCPPCAAGCLRKQVLLFLLFSWLSMFVFGHFWHSNQADLSRNSIWQSDSAQQ